MTAGYVAGPLGRLGPQPDGWQLRRVSRLAAVRCAVGLGPPVRVGHGGRAVGRVTRLQIDRGQCWGILRIDNGAVVDAIARGELRGVSCGWLVAPWQQWRSYAAGYELRRIAVAHLMHVALCRAWESADSCVIAAVRRPGGEWVMLPEAGVVVA